tara:strand:- start:4496 stop:5737 length:1242 start_codon:yes stop_codon:yes gene_type:complete
MRNYYDPLHKRISLNKNLEEESIIIDLIDSEPFQRLRRIRQLGPASLTFHGAESSRFTHSLGVFDIARRALLTLISQNKELEKYKILLYCSALLHDLGHGPLSHTSEEMFGINHEYWSAKIIQEHPQITNALEKSSKTSAEQIANLIIGVEVPNKAIKSLISSQLDCDRLDYLLRDSYSTGASYGQLDLERILSALTLSPDGDLAINSKGLMAVEHYLVIRNLMYRSVYNHRLNEVSNWLLELVIKTARELGQKKVWADKYMQKWLWELNEMDVETYLANDDYLTMYHLFRWKEDGPDPLASLCNRFINRNLFKAIDIEDLSNESQLEGLAIARKLSKNNGEDPNFSCGIRKQCIHGYSAYKGGLRVWDGDRLLALEKISPLVASLIKPTESSWLIHPHSIHKELKASINCLR